MNWGCKKGRKILLALLLPLVALKLWAQPPEELLKVGLGAYKDGFLEVAESQWKKFLKLYPDHPFVPKVRYLLGQTLIEEGRLEEAIRELTPLVGDERIEQGELHYLIGSLHIRMGKWKEARPYLKTATELSPEAPWFGQALLLLGEAHFRLANYKDAIPILRKASQVLRDSTSNRALLLLGLSLLEIGELREAERTLNSVKGKEGDEALFWLSEVRLKLGDPQGALKALSTLMLRYPKSPRLPEAIYKRAQILQQAHRDSEAKGALRGWLLRFKGHPLEPKVRLLLGRLLMKAQNYKEAADILGPVLKKGSQEEQREARHRLIWCHLQMGNLSEAEKLLSRQDDLLSHLLKAKSELFQGRCEEALPYLFELSAKKPFRPFALFEIARCNWRMGKFQDCVANLDVLQLEFPGFEKIDELLWLKAECLREAKEERKARDLYRQILKKHPSSDRVPWALYRLLEMDLGSGHIDQALPSFETLKAKFARHELTQRAGLLIGKALFAQGDYKKAIEALLIGTSSPIKEIRGEALCWLGKAYWRVGEEEKAIGAFERAASQGGEIAALAYVEIGNIKAEAGQREEAQSAYREALKLTQDQALRARIEKLLEFTREEL